MNTSEQHDITAHELREAYRRSAQEILRLKAENQWLKEQLGLAKHRLFAPSADKVATGQEALEGLFNEAEANAVPDLPEPTTETISYTRRRFAGQRERNLANLPVEEIVYELPEEEQVCPQCAGKMHAMGADVREEIQIVPATFTLLRHLRTKYACRHCQNHENKTPILTASLPETAFPNSLASPSAVAHIMTRKFVEGTPLYRQEQSLERQGLELSRQTMSNWMLTGADWLDKVYARLRVHLVALDIAHADETPVQVLREAGRAAESKSYMWLYRSGRYDPAIVLFEYQPTREGIHPKTFLRGFVGKLQADGYVGYEGMPGVELSGCWSHVRRKFVEALNLLPKTQRKQGGTTAHEGMAFCDQLFAIERDLHDVSPEERLAGRLARSHPVLEKMRAWLEEKAANVLSKSALGGAIGYARHQWPKLQVFLTDGRLELDNNRAERSIKPFVIGRKNWLFANTPRGARSSAIIYSIVETAKENGLNPFAYLTYLFEQLPNINVKDPEVLDRLLPWSEAVQAKCRVPSKTTR